MTTHDSGRTTPALLPRRTIVAAGAWTVPIVAAATAAPAYAASPCQTVYDYTLDWTNVGANYVRAPSGVAAYAMLTSVPAGGDPIYVHFNTVRTTGTNGNFIDPDRNLTRSSLGTAGSTQDPLVTNLGNTGESGLRLQHEDRGTGVARAQVLTISFRTGTAIDSPLIYVRNVRFSITDIDGLNGGNNYADRVSLSPQPNTTGTIEQFRDTNTVANVSPSGTARVSVRGAGTDGDAWRLATVNSSDVGNTQSYDNIAETSAGARVRVAYEDSIARSMQQLTLKYWTNDTATIYHRMYITNIRFKARRIFCG